MAARDSQTGVHAAAPGTSGAPRDPKALAKLSLAALGVVYGDIGTSPLYAIKECFSPAHGLAVTTANVYGILSLVFWALMLVVVHKYILWVLRADHHGEGGLLALLALVTAQRSHPRPGETGRRRHLILVGLALVGTALLLGEGMITPAISVLGALEGLDVATPMFRPYIVPLAVIILLTLFLFQKRGTAGIGAVFGPATLIWFLAIGTLGARAIARNPEVLLAANPLFAVRFFLENGAAGFLVLGAVVLVVTGGEALFADLGHFGRLPIRTAWFVVACPALLCSYFGQGALLLERGDDVVANPFFELADGVMLYPMVVIATVAAIVASQAMISGSFSIAHQAVQLGFLPRLTIVHTSETASGQIYVPEINRFLLVACLTLVVTFRETTHLAAAYGIAVVGAMTCTSTLMWSVARHRWKWAALPATLLVALFYAVDLPFLGANLFKIASGGWVPVLVGGALFAVMTTWKQGRRVLRERLAVATYGIDSFVAEVAASAPQRVAGTAVFLTSTQRTTPPVLLHHFKHNKVLHEQVILLTIVTEGVPRVGKEERVEVRELGAGFFEVTGHYGFMQTPNVPETLRRCAAKGLDVAPESVSYFLGRETVLTTGSSGLSRWRKSLFAYLARNARPASSFFRLPPNRVVELGAQVEL
jgi:KUP system potassium uptake protein